MPFLASNDGVKLYYEVHGQGTPLILSHGFSANSAMWARQTAIWSKQFQVIVWDMRGHGQSDYPESDAAYSERHCADDILALINHVSGPHSRAVVAGLSLGGHESLAFYKYHPSRVLGLLIMDSSPGVATPEEITSLRERILAHAKLLEEHGPMLLAAMGTTPEKAAAVKHRDTTGLVRAAKGMLVQHGEAMVPILKDIRVPTLLIVGEDDEPFLAPMQLMARTIPGAEYVVIKEAGHAVNFDQPEEVERVCAPFLAKFVGPKASL